MLAVAGHLAELLERHFQGLRHQFDDTADRCRLLRAGIVDGSKWRLFRHHVNRAREIAIVDVRFLGAAAAVQRQFAPGEAAYDGLRNDAMELLPRSVRVRRADDIHGKFQETIDRHEMHVEGGFRGSVGARRLDRLVFLGRVLNRTVKLRCPDLDEALEIVAGLQLLGQLDERHAVGFEIAPRMLQRSGALALRGEIDDDLRLLAVEQLHQKIEFVVHVVGVIAVARIAVADAQSEAFVLGQIATDRDHLGGIGMVKQVFRRVESEDPPPPSTA